MVSQVFAEWFKKFSEMITERPYLLLFDGHISIPVIRRALQENIKILKFPPHITGVMQPLDVSCFSPLKRRWEKPLHERLMTFGAKHQLTKSDVNQLCKVWNEGMNQKNAQSGFHLLVRLISIIMPSKNEKYN